MATKQEPIRRTDVIRCEKCGEDYSITYKRCPFCDERPGGTQRIGGRRVAGGGYRRSNPLQIAVMVLSVVLIITAAFIVFTTLAPLFGKDSPDSSQSQGASSSIQTDISSSDSSDDVSDGGDSSQTELPVVSVNSITLNQSDFTLKANESHQITAAVDPADAAITWSSSNESAAVVSDDGTVTNINTGSSQVKVTITATAGDKSAECTVYCRGGSSASSGASAGSTGKITGADSGLNVRSGPGSSYEAIASLSNGTSVKILEDTGSGWYKISFSGAGGKTTEGYVSRDFVSVG